mgnify:CR=1 FL=1
MTNIALGSIKKVYPNNSIALNGIDLSFVGNGLVTIVGESGSGKTTLLNIIGLLDSATEGTISINNEVFTRDLNTDECDNFRSGQLGYVFQDDILLSQLSIKENILYPLKLKRIITESDISMLNRLSQAIGISDLLERYPHQLSRGQRQRAAIVRALINEPTVLLADEPTGNLDSTNSQTIFELLKDISKDRLVIVVTHNDPLARKYSDRVIELKDGNVVFDNIDKAQQKTNHETKKSSPKRAKYRLPYMLYHSFSDIKNIKSKLSKVCLTGMLALISVLFVFSFSNSARGELNAMEEHLLGKNLLIITEDPESSALAFANYYSGRWVLITEFDFIEDCPLVEEYVLRYDISPHVITAKEPIYIEEITPIKINEYFNEKVAFQGIEGNMISNDNEIIIGIDIAKELYGKGYMEHLGSTLEVVSVYAKKDFTIVGINGKKDIRGKTQTYITENAMYHLALETDEITENVTLIYGPYNLIERKDSSLGVDGPKFLVTDEAFGVAHELGEFDAADLLDGVMPKSREEAIVSIQFLEAFSTTLFGHKFDRELLSSRDRAMDVIGFIYEQELFMKKYNAGKLKIVGIYDDKDNTYGEILLSEEGYRFLSKTCPYRIDVYVKNDADINAATQVFSDAGFDVYTEYENYKDGFASRFDSIRFALYILSVIFLVLTISVINTFSSNNIKDRTKDIGLLRAIGATRNNVINLFLLESASIGFFTSLLTIIVALIMMVVIRLLEMKYIPFLQQISSFTVKGFIFITLIGVGIYVLSALPSVLRTIRMTPKEAIYQKGL